MKNFYKEGFNDNDLENGTTHDDYVLCNPIWEDNIEPTAIKLNLHDKKGYPALFKAVHCGALVDRVKPGDYFIAEPASSNVSPNNQVWVVKSKYIVHTFNL